MLIDNIDGFVISWCGWYITVVGNDVPARWKHIL